MAQLIRISPKGQITIPLAYRSKIKVKQYSFDMKGGAIVLKPVTIQEIKSDTDQLATAAISSFKFWEDPSNDVYEKLL